MQTQTNDTKTVAVKKALVYLKSAGVDFAIIYNGEKFGDLELAPAKPSRAPRKDYLGIYKYMDKLRALKEGDVVKIPVKKEDRFGLQGTICSAMCKMYGNGSYITTTNDDSVEVMRLFGTTEVSA